MPSLIKRYAGPLYSRGSEAGLSLFETLIVVVFIGILAAIGIPTFFKFLAVQRLNTAQAELHQALRQAQHEAELHKQTWRFSIRQRNNQIEWAQHPDSVPAGSVAVWKALDPNITFDLNSKDTSFVSAGGVYYVKFDFRGHVSYRLGRVTLMDRAGGVERRCVIVSTLIGAMRRGENQAKADKDGHYCY